MVLVVVVHTLEAVTATVPICMIALKEAVDRKSLPEELKIRQVLPTSGHRCTSLWDVQDKAVLQKWMDEALGPDVAHEMFEVVEEFSYGIAGELMRIRTAEKFTAQGKKTAGTVAQKTKATFQAAGQKFEELDTRWKVSENTSAALQTAKTTGAAVLGRIGGTVSQTKDKAMENPKVAATVTAMGTGLSTGWKKMGSGLHVARDQVNKLFNGRDNDRTGSGDAAAAPAGAGQGKNPEAGSPATVPRQQDAQTGQEQTGPGQGMSTKVSSPTAVNEDAIFSLGDEAEDAVSTPPKWAA